MHAERGGQRGRARREAGRPAGRQELLRERQRAGRGVSRGQADERVSTHQASTCIGRTSSCPGPYVVVLRIHELSRDPLYASSSVPSL